MRLGKLEKSVFEVVYSCEVILDLVTGHHVNQIIFLYNLVSCWSCCQKNDKDTDTKHPNGVCRFSFFFINFEDNFVFVTRKLFQH